MERKIRKLLAISGIIIAVLFTLSFFKDQLVKSALAAAAGKVLGSRVEIGGLSFGIAKQRAVINNLEIYNPQGFPQEKLLDLPLIDLQYDLSALLAGKLYLPRVRVDLKRLVVIKDKEGKLNVDSLKVSQKPEEAKEKERPQKAMPFRIDYLFLNIGQVVYKDFSQGAKPVVQVYEVNIKNKQYRNLTSAQQFVALVLVESLQHTAIKGAKIYGLAALTGAAVLPVGIASMLISSDSAAADFNVNYDEAFAVSAEVFKQMGALQSENKTAGMLGGAVGDCDTKVKIEKIKDNTVKITVSARKFMLPKREIAAGVLYEITRKLER